MFDFFISQVDTILFYQNPLHPNGPFLIHL